MLRARDAGCQAVLNNTTEPQAIPWIKDAAAQHLTNIDWLFLAPAYTDNVAKTVGSLDLKVYAGSEWEPYTDLSAPANRAWRQTMEQAHLPLTAFSQGGYESATIMVKILQGIQGPITRDSVNHALLTMKPIQTSLTGTPYVFGPGKSHDPNTATRVLQLVNGQWKVVTPNWLFVPSR
jgi:branched-chain amino acid transport system substrate-binding protein